MPFFALVLGSHRSGSSVTIKILQSLGCNLGADLLVGDAFSNEIGHFENLSVLEFNEELLANLGTDWKNPNPLVHSEYYKSKIAEIEDDICALLQDLLDHRINAIKEPRISILLEAWKGPIFKTIPNLKIVVTLRHPAEVASSLQKRDNLNQIVSVQLWVQATLNTIKFARDYSNYFVFYDELISDPKGITKGLAEYLYASNQSEKLSALAAKDVVIDYRHNKVLDGEFTVLNVATEMYEHMSKFHVATPLDFPDELLEEWQKRINSTYKEVNRLELMRVTDLQKDRTIEDLWASSNAVELKLTLERDEIAADRDRIIQGLTSELTLNNSERDQIAAERDLIAADRDRITQHLTSERDQVATERDLITQVLTLKRDEIAGERDQIASERDQIVIERDQIKMDRDRITLQLTAERDQLTSERDQLTAERDQLTAERDQLTAERDQISLKLTSERDQISGERDRIAGERDQIAADRDRITKQLTTERDQLTIERDDLTTERDQLTSERDQLTSERDQLTIERNDLLNSTIWRATKPIRWFVNLFKR